MRGGLINFRADSDGVGRHHDLYLDRKGWRFPSLAAQVTRTPSAPSPDGQTILLNWRSGWNHVSYGDLYLDSLRSKPLRPQDEFRGKIVVIGTSAPGLLDLRLTRWAAAIPGVEILSTEIDNLDRGDWLTEVPRWAMLPLALRAARLHRQLLRPQRQRHQDRHRLGDHHRACDRRRLVRARRWVVSCRCSRRWPSAGPYYHRQRDRLSRRA